MSRSGPGRGELALLGAGAVLTAGSAATHYTASGRVAPFVVAALALAALAAVVGRLVDHLGDHFGSGATGVLQSALGNLPELFFGLFALHAGLVGVVQATLVGSVVANVLLVLGLAFVVGGARHGTQRFPAESARNTAVLLVLAVAVLVVPTVSSQLHVAVAHHERALSDVAAVVLLAVFVLSVPAAVSVGRPDPAAELGSSPAPAGWSLGRVLLALGAAGVAAAFVSDWFVDSLTPALGALHMSPAFAGFVVVAVAGNAVENVVGVQLAARNRADYAVSVVLQSPVQIALALVPALVLLSPVVGSHVLTLVLPTRLVVVLALSALVAAFVIFDGESTWLEGACLIGLYTVLAAAFWWG